MRYFLAILLLFSTAFAADTVINTNKVVMGQKSSAADKLLEFQINAGAANPKIKVNPATAKLQFTNDGTNYKDIGSGGSGSKNFTTLGDAEAGIGTIVGYADAAGTSPIDGTGGSPVSTIAISATTPLENLNSFIFTKDAANRQGNGFSVPFTIDLQQRAKVLNISFKYLVNSGTFVAGSSGVDSDVTVWIHDVTNAQLIQPSSYKLLSNHATIADVFNATFQTASNSSSYRLIFHIGSTSALAYSLKIDDIQVSPSNYVYGTPITDFQNYTPTWESSGTQPAIGNGTIVGKWRRVGDEIEQLIDIVMGGTTTYGTGNYIFRPVSGFTFDTNKLTLGNPGSSIGKFYASNGSAANAFGVVNPTTSTSVALNLSGTNSLVGQLVPFTWASGNVLRIKWSAAITGLSSSVQMSDQTDTRFIGFRARRTTAAAAITGTSGVTYDVLYNIVDFDSHGAYNSATGVFTAPSSGNYKCNASVAYAANATISGFRAIIFNKNSTVIGQKRLSVISASQLPSPQHDDIVQMNAGDTLKIQVNQNSGVTIALEQADANVNTENVFTCVKQSGPNQIAASESVNAAYTTAAGQSIPNNTTTIVDFGTRDYDSHNSVTTGIAWKYTASLSGKFKACASVAFTATAGGAREAYVFKNGVQTKSLGVGGTAGSATHGVSGCASISLIAGDFIDIRAFQNQGAAVTLLANAVYNHVEVERVGN